MKATFLSCTLKGSPEKSNSEALAEVLIEALEKEGVETEVIRLVDFDIKPGVTSDEGCGGLVDIGYTIPGQAWTYWNRGPGPGDDYLDAKQGHPWSQSTGEAAAANLLAVARALAATPIPADE